MDLKAIFLILMLATSALSMPQDRPEEEEEGPPAEGEEAAEEEEDNTVEISTPYGMLKGLTVEDEEDDFTQYRFLGIPYAQAPVGRLRFKDPVPLRPWTGVRNATEFGSSCLQADYFGGKPKEATGTEDCLFLNVFTPRLPSARRDLGRALAGSTPPASSLLPVMVWIHGGGFSIGSGEIDPTPLLKKDVVVVTINYRLCALGFLSLSNSLVPGNMGMKDQVEALKWVQRSIVAFGGDPDKVTIFGESAGGISAHLLTLSPMAEGLFSGAILQSGTALMLAPSMNVGKNEKESERLVKALGCDSIDGYRVMQCLQGKNESEIFKVFANTTYDDFEKDAEAAMAGNGSLNFAPTVDSFSSTPFLPDHPFNILEQGGQNDVPIMAGNTKDDGGFFLSFLYWKNLEAFNANFTAIYGPQLMFSAPVGEATEEEMTKAELVKRFFIGGYQNFTADTKQAMIDLYSDLLFFFPAYKSMQLHARPNTQPVFMYEMAHKPSRSFNEIFGKATGADQEEFGVTHGDDLFFIFKDILNITDAVATDEDKAVADQMTTMWTNFAKHQDPTPYQDGDIVAWEPFNENESYLEIKAESENKEKFYPARMYFWQKAIWDDLEDEIASGGVGSFVSGGVRAPPVTAAQPRSFPAQATPIGFSSQNAHSGTLPFQYFSRPGIFHYEA